MATLTPKGRELFVGKVSDGSDLSTSHSTSDDSFAIESESDDEGLSTSSTAVLCRRFRICSCAVLLGALLLSVVAIGSAYVRGERAATAALEAWAGTEIEEALLRRRGHTVDPESWEQWRAEHMEKYDNMSEPKPLPKVLGSQQEFWGNEWMKAEINRVLEMELEQLNKQVKAMAKKNLGGNALLQNAHIQFDYFRGVESTNVDSFKCTQVQTNLDQETGLASLELRAHPTKPIQCGGRIYVGKGDNHYTFRMQVNNFWVAATQIHGQLELGIPPVIDKVNVGWVDCGYGWLDSTCYSKKDPNKVDGFCTHFMQGKLQKMRGDMIWKMSNKLTQVFQAKFDEEVDVLKAKEGLKGPTQLHKG